ncbi:MAG: hypothetical protein ACJ74W_14490 [Pyrinomonadaceae bacterium]
MTLGIKTITTENWLHPDPASTIFVQLSHSDGSVSPMSGEDWVEQFTKTTSLVDAVPEDVRKLFEVARGALAYGYFFYPLYTLASEQLFRVVECAVSAKCAFLGAPKRVKTFKEKIEFLLDRNVISKQDFFWWDAIRNYRNLISHPEQQTILPPGAIATILYRIAEEINRLFE